MAKTMVAAEHMGEAFCAFWILTCHLVYPDRFTYDWIDKEPHLQKPWTVEDFFAEAAPLGIESALHMEVDVIEKDMMAETEFVLGLPRIVGAIAACRPENMNFVDHIEQLSEHAHVKGVRRILHKAPDDLSTSDLFVENIRHLPDYNLSFDLCLRADQLLLGRDLAQRAPDVEFILDHCGVPRVAMQELDPWRAYITELSQLPNMMAKVSGIVEYAKPDWVVDDLRPFVEHIIESFGWDRVVWGSDHPVSTRTSSVTRWVAATHEIIKGASDDEKAKLLHRNAEADLPGLGRLPMCNALDRHPRVKGSPALNSPPARCRVPRCRIVCAKNRPHFFARCLNNKNTE